MVDLKSFAVLYQQVLKSEIPGTGFINACLHIVEGDEWQKILYTKGDDESKFFAIMSDPNNTIIPVELIDGSLWPNLGQLKPNYLVWFDK